MHNLYARASPASRIFPRTRKIRLAREIEAASAVVSSVEIAILGVESCVYPVPFSVSYIGGLCFFRLQELDSYTVSFAAGI